MPKNECAIESDDARACAHVPVMVSRYFRLDDSKMLSFSGRGENSLLHWDFLELGWWSRIYEYSWMQAVIEHWVGDHISQKVALDAGCGRKHTGCFLMAELGFERVVAQDLFPQHPIFMLGKPANLEYAERDFCEGAACDADIVCCLSVLEHVALERQKQGLRVLCRAVRPGGLLVMTFDMPGFEYPTALELYKHIILDEGFVYAEREVAAHERLTSKNGPVSHPGWPSVGRYELTCYRLVAWHPDHSNTAAVVKGMP